MCTHIFSASASSAAAVLLCAAALLRMDTLHTIRANRETEHQGYYGSNYSGPFFAVKVTNLAGEITGRPQSPTNPTNKTRKIICEYQVRCTWYGTT